MTGAVMETDDDHGMHELERLRSVVRERETRLGQAYARIHALESRLEAAEAMEDEVIALRCEVASRFAEVAMLTRMLEAHTAASMLGMQRQNAPEPARRSIAQRLAARLGRLVRGGDRKLRKEIALVRGSGRFDQAWYLEHYPDVVDAGLDPVEHYLRHGAQEGRDPSPAFRTLDYQARHPELAMSGTNPLVHSIQIAGRARNV